MSTTYMNIDLPVPSVTEGPEWAEAVNTAVETIDAHDHSPGKGTPVPASGISIDADLTLNSNKLTDVTSVNLDSQSSSLAASNVQAVYSVNGDLYYNNSSGTPVQITQGNSIASASSPLVPAGVVWPYGGSSAPTGFLMCDGSAVSRTTYADLFAAVGTSFGPGDGATTFNLPNMQGRVPMGAGTYTDSVSGSITRTLGQTVGAAAHTLTTAEMPSHTHSDTGHTHTFPNGGIGGANYPSLTNGNGSTVTTTTGYASLTNTGGSGSHNNMQPSLGLNYIIKT